MKQFELLAQGMIFTLYIVKFDEKRSFENNKKIVLLAFPTKIQDRVHLDLRANLVVRNTHNFMINKIYF